MINLAGKQIRALAANLMLTRAGKHINIERFAHFSHTTEIGDYSGIGECCRLYGRVVIGDYVIMRLQEQIFPCKNKENRLKKRFVSVMMFGSEVVLLYYRV